MTQGISDKFWQVEARTEETKQFIRDIKRITRRKFSAEEKIRIVLEGFRRDTPIRDLCRREGIRPSTYYAWLKGFMEAGKERLQCDTVRDATRVRGRWREEGEHPAEKAGGRAITRYFYSEGGCPGKFLSPSKRRRVVFRICQTLTVSERRACRVLEQARATQRHSPSTDEKEERLVARIIELATQYSRYGYRRITALLGQEGWQVNHKRVERIWRREGLKVPQKQPKRRRLWLNDGSCIRLRPERKDHVWSYDL